MQVSPTSLVIQRSVKAHKTHFLQRMAICECLWNSVECICITSQWHSPYSGCRQVMDRLNASRRGETHSEKSSLESFFKSLPSLTSSEKVAASKNSAKKRLGHVFKSAWHICQWPCHRWLCSRPSVSAIPPVFLLDGEGALKVGCALKDAHTHAQAHALSLWEKSGKDKMREIKMSDSRVTVKHDREYCLFSAEVQRRHDF